MGASLALQRSIYATLRSNATLRNLLATDAIEGSPTEPAIYDHVPQIEAPEDESYFPYVVIGDDVATEFDTDDSRGQTTQLTFHVWDRYRGRARVKQIIDAIYDAIHDVQITVIGHNVVYCFWELSESIPDPDPMTQHGVTRFRVVTQEGG